MSKTKTGGARKVTFGVQKKFKGGMRVKTWLDKRWAGDQCTPDKNWKGDQ